MPARRATSTGYAHARLLRKSPTLAERKLWATLRRNRIEGVGFRRQHAIGNYIVDFCAVKQKLVIELDGGQHLKQTGYDAERTKYLESQGYQVLRFWNHQVIEDIEAVVLAIHLEMKKRVTPSQPPPNI